MAGTGETQQKIPETIKPTPMEVLEALKTAPDSVRLQILEALGRSDDEIVRNTSWSPDRLFKAMAEANWPQKRLFKCGYQMYGSLWETFLQLKQLGWSVEDSCKVAYENKQFLKRFESRIEADTINFIAGSLVEADRPEAIKVLSQMQEVKTDK